MTTDESGQFRTTARAFEDMVLQHSADAALLLHPQDGVVYASPATNGVLGMAPEALIGMMAAEWVHPDDVGTAIDLRQQSTFQGHGGPVEIRGRHGDGSYRWFEAEWWHVVHHYTVLHLRDVERERGLRLATERTSARLEALLRHSREVVVILRPDLESFDYVSSSLERLLGWTSDSLNGGVWQELVHRDDLPRLMSTIAEARQLPTVAVRTTVRYRASDGIWHTFDTTVTDLTSERHIEGIVINAVIDGASGASDRA